MSEGLWLELDKWIQGELKIIPAKWKIHLGIVYIKKGQEKIRGKQVFSRIVDFLIEMVNNKMRYCFSTWKQYIATFITNY